MNDDVGLAMHEPSDWVCVSRCACIWYPADESMRYLQLHNCQSVSRPISHCCAHQGLSDSPKHGLADMSALPRGVPHRRRVRRLHRQLHGCSMEPRRMARSVRHRGCQVLRAHSEVPRWVCPGTCTAWHLLLTPLTLPQFDTGDSSHHNSLLNSAKTRYPLLCRGMCTFCFTPIATCC